MVLKETINALEALLIEVSRDLDKASRGNKSASQRVRTGTVKLEKIAKAFRRESLAESKKKTPKRNRK